MKRILVLSLGLALLSGCSFLAPKRVEFFQDKVQRFPELKESEKETQRQAAALAASRAEQTVRSALANSSPKDVTDPARDAASLSAAVATSLGPPYRAGDTNATSQVDRLRRAVASYNERVQDFKVDNNENAGKKIEGTGIFSIGYFTMWGVILGGLALVWFGIKVYGLFNPLVGTVAGTVGRISSQVAAKGFSEVVTGGKQFLDWVDKSDLEDHLKEWIVNTFIVSHKVAQSPETKDVVDKLIASRTTSVMPPAKSPTKPE